ncbi:MAG: 16S rRNA (uracil(1498)-N(3))-methyltransferase [Ruminococcus sp.]|nr:16S rRNA (uracil(1498)-N(3))-methyltransferase [Ruminococcus sp.]
MPRFFTDTPPEKEAVITGEDAYHIGRSLRMKPGEKLTLCCAGTDYVCEITRVYAESVSVRVLSSGDCEAEPALFLTLYQALPKSEKMDFIVQKAVELGVGRIVPVFTARCVSRPDEKSMRHKIERWQKIALSAAKQSGRGNIPQIEGAVTFGECIEAASADEAAFFCYEAGGKSIADVSFEGISSASVIVGPEGGFEPEEAVLAESSGITITSLGKRILRCETAPLAAITAIMLRSGNL